MYNHGYSPDKVIRLDYGFGSNVDAVELGDGTLYLKVDLNETTWFGMPYKEACEVLSKYSMGFLVEDEMAMAANILKLRAFGVDKEEE